MLALYKTLHPKDTEATENSPTDVTTENELTDNLYSDLGFIDKQSGKDFERPPIPLPDNFETISSFTLL